MRRVCRVSRAKSDLIYRGPNQNPLEESMRFNQSPVAHIRFNAARCVLVFLIVAVTLVIVATVKPGLAERYALPNLHPFRNGSGILETFNVTGDIDLTGPFFQSLGTNGRS